MAKTKRSTTGAKRSYTGCLTCRYRKVKCDNARPACERCQKSNVRCLGYGIVLQWAKPLSVEANEMVEVSNGEEESGDDEQKKNKSMWKRRKIESVKFPQSYEYEHELDEAVEFCNPFNLRRYDSPSLRKGPFRVFSGAVFGLVQKEFTDVAIGTSTGPGAATMGNSRDYHYNIRTNDSDLRSTYNISHEGTPSSEAILKSLEKPERMSYLERGQTVEADDEEDQDSVEVWIMSEYMEEAKATYFLLANQIKEREPATDDMKRIIFAKYFELENKTMIRCLLDKYRTTGVPKSFQKDIQFDESFSGLIQNFVNNIDKMMPITFKGNIYENLVIPLLYQHIGQLMVNRDHEGSELKRLIIKQALCLSSFFRYQDSRKQTDLQMAINMRKKVMMEMTAVIINLTEADDTFTRTPYTHSLIANFDIKNVILIFILMIKIDYFMQIVENFSTWFKLSDNLISFLNNYNDSILNSLNSKNLNEKLTLDKFINLKRLIKLYRFIKIFYFSTAKIDFYNYELGNEAELFDDIVNEDYNLIKGDFILDDGFHTIEDYFNIEIEKPSQIEMGDKPMFTVNFKNTGDDSSSLVDSEDEEGGPFNAHSNNATAATSGDHDEMDPYNGDNDEDEVDNRAGVLIDIPQPDNGTAFVGDVDDDVNKFSSVEYMYGLPLSLLELFNKIITLTNHKNYFTRKKVFPRNYPKLCCDLEEELKNWKLTWRLFDQDEKFKSTFHEILYHNILSFYNALCIYFERIIKESDPSLIQDYVSATLKHLIRFTEIDDLDTKISPLFWSFFISASDAIDPDLQSRFWQISDHFPGNNWLSKQVILDVWKKRINDGFHSACWLDTVKDWDCDVLLLC